MIITDSGFWGLGRLDCSVDSHRWPWTSDVPIFIFEVLGRQRWLMIPWFFPYSMAQDWMFCGSHDVSTFQVAQKSSYPSKDASGSSLASSHLPAICIIKEPPHHQYLISSWMFSWGELVLGYPDVQIWGDLSRLQALVLAGQGYSLSTTFRYLSCRQ